MSFTRRQLSVGCGAGALAWSVGHLGRPGADLGGAPAAAAVLDVDQLKQLAAFALERARHAGASYADVRINRYQHQTVALRSQPDFSSGTLNHVPSVSSGESFGFGLRVLSRGAWGFSASQQVTRDSIARAAREAVDIARANAPLRRQPVQLAAAPAHQGVFRTAIARDPFTVPVPEKLALLQLANQEMKKVKGVFSAVGVIAQRAEHRFFASSEGSLLEQHIFQVAPEITATAVQKGHKTKTRTYRPHAVTAGYEAVTRARLAVEARRVGEEAVNHLGAPSVRPGKRDLVLLPPHLGLTIHESIGHSTELDRALGWEANFAGTSFLTTDKLGKFRVGADIVSFRGDRTRPESLSTCGWDDDGVATVEFPIIDQGIFVGYQTTRDQAHLVGAAASTACCYADSYASVPFQRMPNVSLVPARTPVTLNDLIGGVDDGVLIDGRGSYSIDQQRYNFQFGGDAFWEIKGGKLVGMIADVAYQSRTPDFWQACDGLGGPDTWQNVGLNADGKGQPTQLNAMSHGCPPARFRQMNVLRTD
jgi:TldD protein